MTETLGKRLASCRARKGLTVRDIAQTTRINARFIEAVEEDRFDYLPGKVFTRGLLRSYAKVVGMDGEEVVARYNDLGLVDADRSPKMIREPLRQDHTRSSAVALAVALLVAVALITAYYMGYQPLLPVSEPSALVPVNPTPPVATEPQPAVMAQEPEPVAHAPVTKSRSEPEPQTGENAPTVDSVEKANRPAPQAEPAPAVSAVNTTADVNRLNDETLPLSLKVSASADSWIKVVVDGEITREIILRGGKSVTWRAGKEYVISIGNVSDTSLLLNNEPVQLGQPTSNVIMNLRLPKAKPQEKKNGELNDE